MKIAVFSLCFVSILSHAALAQECTTGLIPMGYMGVSDENGTASITPSARTNAMALWDPDGAGPEPEMLVVGGAFRSIDGVPANSIAVWNGSTWRVIGDGFPSRLAPAALDASRDSEVTALTVYNGTLYAAGRLAFSTPDGVILPLRIARWTGTSWEQVGQDISSQTTARINAIQFAYDRLYVGGTFSYLYNGVTNYAFGYYETLTPTSPLVRLIPISSNSQSVVRTMALHNDELFVGGNIRVTSSFDHRVARVTQSGSVLSTLVDCANSCSGAAQQLVSTDGQLYLAGDYTLSNNTRRAVARYLGTNLGWEIVGPNPTNIASGIQVSIALDENSNLIRSTGEFVERWNGTAWIPLGSINGGTSIMETSTVTGRLLGSYQGHPIFGGKFTSVQDGDLNINNVRFLESLAFVNSDGYLMPISQGVDSAVSDMALIGDDIVAVGRMGSAGGQRCNNIAVFGNDNRWRPWSNNDGFERPTRSIAIYQGQPIVSGGYNAPGQATNPFVRRWDGSQWIDMPVPPNGVVETFTVAGDELWAEVLPSRGSTSAPWVYRWDGSQWIESPAGQTIRGLKNCLGQVWGTRTSSPSTFKVMRWTGTVWEEVGPLTSAGKTLLGELQGHVYARGVGFEMYRLENETWQYVGTYRFGADAAQYSTRRTDQLGDTFFVSGLARTQGGIEIVPTVRQWTNQGWSYMGELPINIPGQTITWTSSTQGAIPIVRNGEVFVGGLWVGRYKTGGSGQRWKAATSFFAKVGEGWASDFAPLENLQAEPTDTVIINSGATAYTTGLWTRNGALFTNGLQASGAFISGIASQVLVIDNVTQAEAGAYSFASFLPGCVGDTNSQGTRPTSYRGSVTLTIGNICDSIDFNNDGSSPDPQDIEAFLSVFSEGPCIPDTATCNDIDFNNDTSVFDPRDIESFLSVYSEGACL